MKSTDVSAALAKLAQMQLEPPVERIVPPEEPVVLPEEPEELLTTPEDAAPKPVSGTTGGLLDRWYVQHRAEAFKADSKPFKCKGSLG